MDNNYKEEQGLGEQEVNAYSTVDIISNHMRVYDNEKLSVRELDQPQTNPEQDGYDHLGKYSVEQPDTGHNYDTFRNTCCVYDTTANISKPERTDNVYDSVQAKKEVS